MFVLFPGGALAGSLDDLRAFLSETRSGRAAFKQIVLDKNLTTLQEASGSFVFQRPGKFRWVYDKPVGQLIVGDGEKLWIYDNDLKQVTVKKLDQALGQSPAALLAGNNDIEKHFQLKDLGRRGSMDWLEARPTAKNSGFDLIRLGFDKGAIDTMELHDNFGQTTVIRFSRLERNPSLDAALFRFTPPPGADVIGE
jgi:outer membrane lipoprotein carrier protein